MATPKQPPYSIEAEQSTLGGILLDNRVFDELMDRVSAEDFYRHDHQLIFGAISELLRQNRPCDFVTLSEYMRESKKLDQAGGLSYLGTLAADTPSAANTLAYATIVRARAVERRLIAAGQDISDLGFRADGRSSEELLAAADRIVNKATTLASSSDPVLIGSLANAWLEQLNERKKTGRGGMPTGLRDLDAKMGGLEPGDLWMVIGDSGVGKTVFALAVADYVARNEGFVLGESLEMPSMQWLSRLVTAAASVDSMKIKIPSQMDQVDEDAVIWSLNKIAVIDFLVEDTPGLSMMKLRAQCLRLRRKLTGQGKKIKLIVVDYIQLMSGERQKGDSKTNELLSISRGMKALAKEMQCAILCLAQLDHTAIMAREDHRPRRGDLGEAKGMFNDCDHFGGVYVDSFYYANSIHAGIMEYIGMKGRNNGKFVAELAYEAKYAKLSDYNGPTKRERIAAAAPPDAPPKEKKPRPFKKPSSARTYGEKDE